jgi:hypothetical protein
MLQNVFRRLKGPWIISCNVCGTEAEHDLDTVWIESLIKNRFARVQCANPSCRNHGPIFRVRKTLSELIEAYLTRP